MYHLGCVPRGHISAAAAHDLAATGDFVGYKYIVYIGALDVIAYSHPDRTENGAVVIDLYSLPSEYDSPTTLEKFRRRYGLPLSSTEISSTQ